MNLHAVRPAALEDGIFEGQDRRCRAAARWIGRWAERWLRVDADEATVGSEVDARVGTEVDDRRVGAEIDVGVRSEVDRAIDGGVGPEVAGASVPAVCIAEAVAQIAARVRRHDEEEKRREEARNHRGGSLAVRICARRKESTS